jgi:hypothetical protein
MKKIRVVFLSLFVVAFFLLFQNKELNFLQKANAQTCTVPAQVTGVSITFPSCVGTSCNFTQGSCSWGAVTGATSYHVVVTEVETNVSKLNQTIATTSASIIFPVTESNTYKCDVSAINSCGTGTTGTASLLCKVDAGVSATPTPTPIPTLTPTPAPVIPVTGNSTPLMLFGILSMVLIIGGIAAFRF